MAILTDTGFPPTFLNRYVLSELAFYGLMAESDILTPGGTNGGNVSPMIPAQSPTNIEDLYNDSIQIRQTESPVVIVLPHL